MPGEEITMPKWTDQQRDAIADRGHSLIVCAAAGSGKTAVLVERIVQLVRQSASRTLSGAGHRSGLSHRRRAGVRRAQPTGDGGRDLQLL